MKNILPHLDKNLQEIYRKALDADARLNQLKQQGMGKFASIFPKQSVFQCADKQFMPYVEELTEDVAAFRQNADQQTLTRILQKMEQLHKVLTELKNITQGN